MRHWATLAAIVAALAMLATPAGAAPADRQQLEQAVNRFQTGRVEEAAELLEQLLRRPLPKDAKAAAEMKEIFRQARPTYAACLVGTGKVAEADGVILDHLRNDPFFQLTPGKFPAEVADRFDIVRAQNAEELERERQKILERRQQKLRERQELKRLAAERLVELERMAAEVKVIRQRSRWLAAMPLGTGQFQNDDVGLGVFFAVSQTAAIVGNIVTGAIGADLLQVRCETDGLVCEEVTSQYNVLQTSNWITFGSAIALVAAGIIEAQVSYEDNTVSYQKRPIPKPIVIQPDIGTSTDGGVFVGLRGQF